MGLIACHTFPDHRFWHSSRLPGNPFYLNRRWPVIRDNLPPCPDEHVWPLRQMIALHVQENTIMKETIRRTSHVSPELAYYIPRKNSWELCRGNATTFAILTGRDELHKWTPVLRFQKGGQGIAWSHGPKNGPRACAQCTGLPHGIRYSEHERIAVWNQTGWAHFYNLIES